MPAAGRRADPVTDAGPGGAGRQTSRPDRGGTAMPDSARPDTDETAVPDRRAAAALTVMRLFRALERVDAGLTPQQYRILKLAGAGGERSARLAERLAVAKPTLTTTADGLVAAGLALREPELGDRRVVRLCLTPAGQAAVDRADAAYSGWLDKLLQATGEAGQVLHHLDLLDRGMDELRRSRLAGLAGQKDPAVRTDQLSDPVRPEETRALAAPAGPAPRPASRTAG